jgi:hypothetical protein
MEIILNQGLHHYASVGRAAVEIVVFPLCPVSDRCLNSPQGEGWQELHRTYPQCWHWQKSTCSCPCSWSEKTSFLPVVIKDRTSKSQCIYCRAPNGSRHSHSAWPSWFHKAAALRQGQWNLWGVPEMGICRAVWPLSGPNSDKRAQFPRWLLAIAPWASLGDVVRSFSKSRL